MKGMTTMLTALALIGVLLVAGCTTQSGDKILEDGTVVKSDGTMIKTDGTTVAPDGTMTKPDGTVIKPDGTMIQPDGTTIGPDAVAEKNDSMMKEDAMMEKNGTAFSEEGLTEFANNYYRYDPVAFDNAIKDGKVVFLDFHADWCPICSAERPAILDGFNGINYADVVGFQVHYNDGNTKSFDNDAIKKYQVAYQHTKVIIGKDGAVLKKTLEVFDKNRVVSEIEAARVA